MDETTTITALKQLFDSIVADLTSHQEALRRLTENQEAQHKKMLGMGELLNRQTCDY
jgi:hypothetical protein